MVTIAINKEPLRQSFWGNCAAQSPMVQEHVRKPNARNGVHIVIRPTVAEMN